MNAWPKVTTSDQCKILFGKALVQVAPSSSRTDEKEVGTSNVSCVWEESRMQDAEYEKEWEVDWID